MKILYVVTQADAGGAQKYVLELAKAVGGEIACGGEKNHLANLAQNAGIKIHILKHLKRSISPWHDFLAFFELIKLVKQTKPDILHLNSSKAGVLGSFIKLFVKAKIIYTAHGFVFNEPLSLPVKWFYIFAERLASLFRDHIIAVSEADRNSGLYHHIISPNKISVIHSGISQLNFLPPDEAKKQLNLPENKIIIGTIANFYKTKGLDILIKAVTEMDKTALNNFYFVIIGDGGQRKIYENLIKQNNLENNFLLLGQKPEASQYLKAFNLFVFPSRKEGFSFILLEAMQAGLPIIATDVGGNKEALNDAGILIKPEQPAALAKAIIELLQNPGKQKELSTRALIRSKEFTLDKMVTETETIYQKVISKNQ